MRAAFAASLPSPSLFDGVVSSGSSVETLPLELYATDLQIECRYGCDLFQVVRVRYIVLVKSIPRVRGSVRIETVMIVPLTVTNHNYHWNCVRV